MNRPGLSGARGVTARAAREHGGEPKDATAEVIQDGGRPDRELGGDLAGRATGPALLVVHEGPVAPRGGSRRLRPPNTDGGGPETDPSTRTLGRALWKPVPTAVASGGACGRRRETRGVEGDGRR